MKQPSQTSDNYCYRHPDRQSFILCQRCLRTICPECQIQAPVGVHCVECTRANKNLSVTSAPIPQFLRAKNAPTVTYTLIAVTVFVYVLQLVPFLGITQTFWYAPVFTQLGIYPLEPWRMLTYALLHAPFSFSAPTAIFHLVLNMYSLYIFGKILEPLLGRWRFLALYLLSALGGALAVDFLSQATSPVVGASGAIFGLMGAAFIFAKKMGGTFNQLFVLLALNLIIGFVVPGISWQAHIGGLLFGFVTGLTFFKMKNRDQKIAEVFLLLVIFLVIVVATVLRALI